MDIIIFENADGTIGVTSPAPGIVAADIAGQTTPTGRPYWLKDSSVLPSTREYRNSWRLDGTEGTPDGYGD